MLEKFIPVLVRFLQTLHLHGRADVTANGSDIAKAIDAATQSEEAQSAATRLLQSWHREASLDVPGEPLAFHAAAALWGARLLFRAACLVTYRDLEGKDIARWIRDDPMPDATMPAAHHSADLCLRHWADLYRMARARSEDDPLVSAMAALIKTAPLAAPGMHLTVSAEHSLFRHPGLTQLFAERALERSDTICLALPHIHVLVRSKLGAYATELAQGLLPTELPS